MFVCLLSLLSIYLFIYKFYLFYLLSLLYFIYLLFFCSPKGDYIYRVKDYASRAVVEVEWLDSHHGVTFPKFGEQDAIAKATYAVSLANAKHAFLLLFLDNASQKDGNYILLAQNE